MREFLGIACMFAALYFGWSALTYDPLSAVDWDEFEKDLKEEKEGISDDHNAAS